LGRDVLRIVDVVLPAVAAQLRPQDHRIGLIAGAYVHAVPADIETGKGLALTCVIVSIARLLSTMPCAEADVDVIWTRINTHTNRSPSARSATSSGIAAQYRRQAVPRHAIARRDSR